MCYCLAQWRDCSLAGEDVLANEDALTHRAAFPSAPASKPQPVAVAAAQAPASTVQKCSYIKFTLSYLCFDQLAQSMISFYFASFCHIKMSQINLVQRTLDKKQQIGPTHQLPLVYAMTQPPLSQGGHNSQEVTFQYGKKTQKELAK